MVLQPLTSTHVTTPPARSLAAKKLAAGKGGGRHALQRMAVLS